MLLHNKRALVREGSGYPRNGDLFGHVRFSTSASCYETRFTSYSESKVYSMSEL